MTKKKKPRKTSSWVCTLGNYLQNMLQVLKWNEKTVTYRVVYSVWYGRKWYAKGLKLQQVTLRDGFELKFHHSCLSISSLYILHTSDRRNNKRCVCVGKGRVGGWWDRYGSWVEKRPNMSSIIPAHFHKHVHHPSRHGYLLNYLSSFSLMPNIYSTLK